MTTAMVTGLLVLPVFLFLIPPLSVTLEPLGGVLSSFEEEGERSGVDKGLGVDSVVLSST